MRNIIEGFNQPVLLKLGLGPSEAIFLRWFLSFMASTKEQFIDDPKTHERFYWLTYSKMIDDLPILFKSKRMAQRLIYNLTSPGKPLIKKDVHTRNGIRTYYRFDPEILKAMEGSSMADVLISAPKKLTVNPKLLRDRPLNGNVAKLLEELSEIMATDGKALFSNRPPQDDRHYTKSIAEFQKAIMSIRCGSFFKDYRCDPKWLERNNELITPETKSEVRQAMNDWDMIRALVLKAAHNYLSWFEPGRAPEKKEWLPRSVSDWMYSKYSTGESIFLACVSGKQFKLRETAGERTFKSLSKPVEELGSRYYNLDWDGFTYWNKIKSMVEWYRKYSKKLAEEDSNFGYWIDGGLVEWMGRFFDWLTDFTYHTGSTIALGHLGTGNRTWRAWLNHSKRFHNIEVELPVS